MYIIYILNIYIWDDFKFPNNSKFQKETPNTFEIKTDRICCPIYLWEISVFRLDMIYRYMYLQNISFYLRVYFIPACSVASAADIHSDNTSVKHDIRGKVCIFWWDQSSSILIVYIFTASTISLSNNINK